MREFLPKGQVTGIGSLPHHNPDDAIRFIAQHSATIPFWPQLPQRSENEMMIPQMLSLLHDLLKQRNAAHFEISTNQVQDFNQRLRQVDAVLDESAASGFFAFERACEKGMFTQAAALKAQITGPVTLAHCLSVGEIALASIPVTFELLTDYLCRLGVWEVNRLGKFGKPVLIFIDEPALSLAQFKPWLMSGLKKLVTALQAAGAYVGIHSCASDQPALLCQAKPNIISFDAHLGLETFLASDDIHAFVEAGGWLALGIIPTLKHLHQFDVMQAFIRLISAIEGNYPPAQFASRSLITATCGLGLLQPDSANQSFDIAHQLSVLFERMSIAQDV